MSIHTKYAILLYFTAFFLIPATTASVPVSDRFVVVIDAGHGGKDPGAVSAGYNEKDINLSVALKLGKMLQDSCPKIRVVYTRMTDVFVGLNERSSLCNRVHANLFISIHSNSSRNVSARGMETYIMGTEKSSDNLRVAMLENSVITQEDGYGVTYEGYNPNSTESFIIFSLQQHAFQTESLNLASEIQKQYISCFADKVVDKGVKQSNFLVLWRTACPSILTEIGFLSNSIDRSFIVSQKGQSSIALSLYNAVVAYYGKYKTKPEQKNQEKKDTVVQVKGRPVFKVQLLALKQAVPIIPRNFYGWTDGIECKYENGLFKYYIGSTNVYEEILTLQDRLRKKFPDCFIVAFLNDESIRVSEARQMK